MRGARRRDAAGRAELRAAERRLKAAVRRYGVRSAERVAAAVELMVIERELAGRAR